MHAHRAAPPDAAGAAPRGAAPPAAAAATLLSGGARVRAVPMAAAAAAAGSARLGLHMGGVRGRAGAPASLAAGVTPRAGVTVSGTRMQPHAVVAAAAAAAMPVLDNRLFRAGASPPEYVLEAVRQRFGAEHTAFAALQAANADLFQLRMRDAAVRYRQALCLMPSPTEVGVVHACVHGGPTVGERERRETTSARAVSQQT